MTVIDPIKLKDVITFAASKEHLTIVFGVSKQNRIMREKRDDIEYSLKLIKPEEILEIDNCPWNFVTVLPIKSQLDGYTCVRLQQKYDGKSSEPVYLYGRFFDVYIPIKKNIQFPKLFKFGVSMPDILLYYHWMRLESDGLI